MSSTHVVLIPSYNSGPRLLSTVQEALRFWQPVWVVVDGSTDRSFEPVLELSHQEPALKIIFRESNGGKGAALLTGAQAAAAAGYSHLLAMDSDGQHPADYIEAFMHASQNRPDAAVLGIPVFGPEVPLARLHGRKLSVGLACLETWGGGIDDPLFGFRVYPIASLIAALQETHYARGFDFDPEIAVRLFWNGVPILNRPAPCRYWTEAAGGISHFHYVRDNLKMVWLHIRLLSQFLFWRWPAARRAHRAWRAQSLLTG
jgi:glycosyltransferase involved in cell wall biosynthesis